MNLPAIFYKFYFHLTSGLHLDRSHPRTITANVFFAIYTF